MHVCVLLFRVGALRAGARAGAQDTVGNTRRPAPDCLLQVVLFLRRRFHGLHRFRAVGFRHSLIVFAPPTLFCSCDGPAAAAVVLSPEGKVRDQQGAKATGGHRRPQRRSRNRGDKHQFLRARLAAMDRVVGFHSWPSIQLLTRDQISKSKISSSRVQMQKNRENYFGNIIF